jgi:glycerol 3-phosphatase-2
VTAPLVVCDLDGVLWRGADPIPGSAEAVGKLRGAGMRVAFLTNNSGPTPADLVDKLAGMGVPAEPGDVLSSAEVAVDRLRQVLEPGARVFACSGPGVTVALEAAGFSVVDRAPAAAVVVGYHRSFDYDELARASAAVRAGARLLATNSDATFPGADGLLPGNGAIVAAIETASGVRAEVTGKPHPAMVEFVRRRLGATGVMVGDRVSTDGALADALGWPFALVLSGVSAHDGAPGGEAVPDPPPAFVAADLFELAPRLIEARGPG